MTTTTSRATYEIAKLVAAGSYDYARTVYADAAEEIGYRNDQAQRAIAAGLELRTLESAHARMARARVIGKFLRSNGMAG